MDAIKGNWGIMPLFRNDYYFLRYGMKVKGTKKLLIIFFALMCAAGAGLGIFLTRSFSRTDVAYAATESNVLPTAVGEKASDAVSAADIEARDALSQATGIAPELISFYARSNGSTEAVLYDYYLKDSMTTTTDLYNFVAAYTNGEIAPVSDISDEDWYVAPDEGSNYDWSAYHLGAADTITAYSTTKSGNYSKEALYYRNVNYQMGPYLKWYSTSYDNKWAKSKHSFMYFSIVWLEEGEEYTFGYTLGKSVNNVFAETMSSEYFLSTSTTYDSNTKTYSESGVRNELFSGTSVNIDPDTSRNTYGDYLDEFGSTITPTTDSYTFTGGSAANSTPRLTVKPDAPSGAYIIVAQASPGPQAGQQFCEMNGSENAYWYRSDGNDNNYAYYVNYSNYLSYAVLVCRKGITKPKLEYGDGVNGDLDKKEVEFNNQDHTIVIQNDWGPGLIDYVISEYDESTGSWTDYAKNTTPASLTLTQRGARGTVTKTSPQLLKFTARNAGKYKIKMIPFRNWGEDESDRDPVEFDFIINPMRLDLPSLVNETGVNATRTEKKLNETGDTLYVSVYPALPAWTSYTVQGGSLGQFDWSQNGVLTLSQKSQGTYDIYISLKYNVVDTTTGNVTVKNMTWSDGTTDAKKFTFIIDKMKAVVPDIIQSDDGGNLTKFTKTITFNGAEQTLSFMPYDSKMLKHNAYYGDQFDADGNNVPLPSNMITVKDNTLTFAALDAGHYVIEVSVSDRYEFDISDPTKKQMVTYELIILEKAITAPVFNESGPNVVGNTKTVTYGGEKMPDGIEDWVETISFTNADQSLIIWQSDTLNQQFWRDSTLILSGRSARTYSVTFKPQKNYKWDEGVVVPTYYLVIEKLEIAKPTLINDGEQYAEYTETTKTVPFRVDENNEIVVHPFMFEFGTLGFIKDKGIIYTKSSSIEFNYNGTFNRQWEGGADEYTEIVTFTTSAAGTYTFEIKPTNNYCWEGGENDSVKFTLIVLPIEIKSLAFYATNQYDSGLREYTYNSRTGYSANLNYAVGKPKTVRIGNPDPKNDAERYITDPDNDYAKNFYILDEDGNYYKNPDEKLEGTAAKLKPGMTCSEEGGFLTLTMENAGVYRIGVVLVNTNFWWAETNESMIVYTLTINESEISIPAIDESKSDGHDIRGHFSATEMHGTYYDINFVLAVTLSSNDYRDFIEIDDPKGNTFKYDYDRTEGGVIADRDAALAVNKGIYTDWYGSTIYFYAKDQGEYTWTIRLTSPNHKWAGRTGKEISFTIKIDRSPVSGLEMLYIGDSEEAKRNGGGILVSSKDVKGGEDERDLTLKYATTYGEEAKVFYFQRSDIRNLVDTGFSTQYSYKVNKFVMDTGYSEADLKDVIEIDFDKDMLKLSAEDAGTYEIIITPTDNYRWDNDAKSISSIKFTLVINKLVISKPLVVVDNYGNGDITTTDLGSKTDVYANKYLTLQLDLGEHPKGYTISSFEYISNDKNNRTDLVDVKIDETGIFEDSNGVVSVINLGVDPDTALMSVQAQSAGEYRLIVVVSNINNYIFADNEKFEYPYFINRLSVTLPDAYLYKPQLSAADASNKDKKESDVITFASDTNLSETLGSGAEGALTVEFDSYFHAVYLHGDSVKKGYFDITVTTATNNGKSVMQVIQPTDLLNDNVTIADYFRLAAYGVNTYTVTLKFVTLDYIWDNDISTSAQTRSFRFIITSKMVDVPTIQGEKNLTLVNDKYTVEFPYLKDGGTGTDPSHRMITLENVDFGVITGTSPATYAIINSKVSASSTASGVLLTNNYPATGTVGTITMATSLNGTSGGEAQVTYTYIIELSIDTNNMRWNTGGVGDINTKYYEIKIVKQRIARPYIIDTVNSTGDNKIVTYTGDVWTEALNIALMDPTLVGYTMSHTATPAMTDTYQLSATVKGKPYDHLLTVSTPAPADTYSVVAKIIDPNNMEWADGTVDDITFSLVVKRLQVAKPYIYIETGKTEASEGVIGLTRTVMFEDHNKGIAYAEEYLINVGNYWANGTDTNLSAQPYIPDIMSYAVAAGTPTTETYNDGVFTTSDYNAFNNGLLILGGKAAGRYILRFTLSGNAEWADGSLDAIDVILQIDKKTHKDLVIYADDPTDGKDEITGNTISYTYQLDENGEAIERFMRIDNFDTDLMDYNGLTSGKDVATYGAGYFEDTGDGLGLSGNSYTVKASKSGDYVIEFELKDFANHRWEFADVKTCSFTLNIKKLKITQPVINTEYNLSNETFDGRTLTVDYDKRQHTILVQSLFEKLQHQYYGTAAFFDGSGVHKYYTVEDTTVTKNTAIDPAYNAATHADFFDGYDTTSHLTIKNLFEMGNLTSYVYDGVYGSTVSSFINLFQLTAYTPGDYYMTFTLTDPDNMEWADEAAIYLDYKIVINKVKHAAPTVATGTSTSLEYTGSPVEFTLSNVFNGVMTEGGSVVSTPSEKYEITNYTGPDADITANFATMDFEVKWFNGVLVLGFTEIGIYEVTVSITDPDYIEWENDTRKSIPFTFVVAKRTIGADVTFHSIDNSALNLQLEAHNNVWPITLVDNSGNPSVNGIETEIVLTGLRDVPANGKWSQRLEFKVYYEAVTAIGTEINPETYSDTDTPVVWASSLRQNDGTYSLTLYFYGIDHGKGNITKGNYNLCIAQIDTDGNHYFDVIKIPFEVEADPAPFSPDMLEWVYTRSDDPATGSPIYYSIDTGLGQSPDNRFNLYYEEYVPVGATAPVSVTYTFYVQLKAQYRDGLNGILAGVSPTPTVKDQLNSYFVDWDGSYGGTRMVTSAGTNYSVNVKITDFLPMEYKFDDYYFTLHYVVNKAKYNLSNLEWDYDGTPFTYDETATHSIKVKAKTGTSMPTGLNMGTYYTSGTYTTYNATGPITFANLNTPTTRTVTRTGTNVMAFAGEYTTEATFTNSNANYELPRMNDPASYTGSFTWTKSWTIAPKHIVVDWVQGQTTSSDGTVSTRSKPAIAGTYSGNFGFIYEVEDATQPSGWREVGAITRTPGTTVNYRATAYLKSGSNATDYARNYTFELLGRDNPLEFEVGGDDTEIFNHITINGTRNTDYEYTGKPVETAVVIDFDTSNGQITEANIVVLYYKWDTVNNKTIGDPIAAPTEIGNYIVILKLWYSGTTEDFVLSEETYEFNIIKAKLKADDFEWRLTHGDGTGEIVVKYDAENSKWINVDTNEEVTIDYDGKPYTLSVYSEYDSSVVSFTIADPSKIDAGTYTNAALATLDSAHYEFDPANPFVLSFTWTIEKHYLDLKDVIWNYEAPYVYTVVQGKPKAFAALLDNLPEYLEDKVKYTTYREITQFIDGDITDYGNYTTTVEILESEIDTANYILGTWPALVDKTLNWEIKRREITVPENDRSWTEFDGIQHNLLKPFGFPVDWAEYFDVDVTYTDCDGVNRGNYDGTDRFGGKYYAYNAGTYTFTLKIRQEFNSHVTDNGSAIDNIVWVISDGTTTRKTKNDQTVKYSVDKKQLVVTGWYEDFEASHVNLLGNVDSTKFVDYEFYVGNTGSGTKAELDDILNSGGGEEFSMVPVVRAAYGGNITLTFNDGCKTYVTFTTLEISEDDAIRVSGKPYIYGYSINGVIYYFTNEQIASGEIEVDYSGKDVTFLIDRWDTYFVDYVTVYGGSLDDLTQSEAGEYSLTLILRRDLEKPLYWGKTADNKIDRGAVVLNYKISYKMLTVPELPEEVTYDGSEINILSKVTNTTLNKLLAEYGEYVEITGNTATNAGEYTMYLTIKDEFGTAVRWNVGEVGLAGTYSINWKINPVLLLKPEQNLDASITYDGKAHSVYEVLKGYDPENITPAMLILMANVKEIGGRGINAGPYHAELSLPNENYAWCDANGKMLEDRKTVEIDWEIGKQLIDFSKAYWGYMDGDTEVKYDVDKPFVFTLENGKVKNFTVEIFGMPEIIKFYTTYRTNGKEGVNYGGAVGTYTTTVQIDTTQLDENNYRIILSTIPELVWGIVPRDIELPVFDGSWKEFDGKIHDLAALLGLPEDWAEYMDITVEFRETEADSFTPYNGENDFAVGYSNYNGFYFGFYKLTVTLKNDGITFARSNFRWVGGVDPEDIVIQVTELIVDVTGWVEDDENSHVIFGGDINKVLPDEIADKFDYIIYEDGNEDVIVKPEDVVGGKTYYIEFIIKDGANESGIAYSYGIKLVFEKGVSNPLMFGSFDFGKQEIIWLPMPVLNSAVLEYNGEVQKFEIKDFNELYALSYTQRLKLNALYSLGLGDSVTSYVYLQNSNSLTVTSAGNYTAVLRLLSKVRLSWYDPEIYSVNSAGKLIYRVSGTVVTDAEITALNLFNNKSFTLNFTVTPKKVPVLTDEDLEKLAGIVVGYDGREKDVTKEAKEIFDELEAKYGKIFEYTGNKGTDVDTYELTITLADTSSCFWYVGEPKQQEVKVEGYIFRYVADGTGWKLVLVKEGDDGNPEIDSAGNFVEYNYGDYKLDVSYLPEFETEFVKIKEDGDPDSYAIINEDGTLNTDSPYYYLLVGNNRVEISTGVYLTYTYFMDVTDSTKVARYSYNTDLKTYMPDTNGDMVKRIKLDVNADAKYGYKVTVKEDVTEYSYLFSKLTVVDGTPVAAVDGSGNFIDTYLFFDGTKYELRKYTLDASGSLIPDGAGHFLFTQIELTCELKDTTAYSFIGGQFVANANGEYMLRYVLDGTGRKQQIVYAKDTDGNLIVDVEHTKIYEFVYEPAKDTEFKVKWEIGSSVLKAPVFDEDNAPEYTGKTIYAKDILEGFIPEIMEIVEGGEGVDAGDYYAKIVLTTNNSKWDSSVTNENYVIVKWHIDTAKVDLSDVKWVYTDGTNTYEDSSEFIYTRVNGKPVVYWVELANLPEALKNTVVYTTNGVPGAYAGRDAGKYVTSFKFPENSNIEAFERPDTLPESVTWTIQRRMLDVPEGSVKLIFDSQVYNLLELLGVPEDWNEYFDIKVEYADNFVDYQLYTGYEGDLYKAFGAGAYKFTFAIKAGINTSVTNPSVAWRVNGTTAPSVPEGPGDGDTDGDTDGDSGVPATYSFRAKAPVKVAVYSEETEEITEAFEETVETVEFADAEIEITTTTQQAKDVRALEVCDRLKELALGAEAHIKSLKRGTV